jgi:hypothetical protein
LGEDLAGFAGRLVNHDGINKVHLFTFIFFHEAPSLMCLPKQQVFFGRLGEGEGGSRSQFGVCRET